MHAATPRIGIQTIIFSEHEVFEDCCHLYQRIGIQRSATRRVFLTKEKGEE